jgi:hypothetical protein
MCSRDLLREPIAIGGKMLSRTKFFHELQESLKKFFAEDHVSANSTSDVIRHIRSYVCLCRAAITTLANEKDFDTINYILKLDSNQSRRIFTIGKELAPEEFNLLQVFAQTDKELKQKLEQIRHVQEKITIPAIIRLVVQHHKYSKAALFQGLEGMAEFYRSRYDCVSNDTTDRKVSSEH